MPTPAVPPSGPRFRVRGASPLGWLARRVVSLPEVRWPFAAMLGATLVARLVPDLPEVRLVLFWGLHVGLAVGAVAVGRVLLRGDDPGALVAQARWQPVAWWLRLHVVLAGLAFAWLATGVLGLGFDPLHPVARIFAAMALLAALGGFAAGAVAPRHPAGALLAPAALWAVFYFFAEAAPEPARTAGGQMAFTLGVTGASLATSFLALSRRLSA